MCGNRDEWLDLQYREKRRCRALCVTITLAMMVAIVAVVSMAFLEGPEIYH